MRESKRVGVGFGKKEGSFELEISEIPLMFDSLMTLNNQA